MKNGKFYVTDFDGNLTEIETVDLTEKGKFSLGFVGTDNPEIAKILGISWIENIEK